LLDTAFAHPSVFKRLKTKAGIKHVRHDYNLSRQTEDKDIYVIATKENRIIVTQDDGFRKQILGKGTGVIIIPSYLTNDEIDLVVSEYISGRNPDDFRGKAIKITNT
jgi:predicted nuclease of predicted toxin-antitoxin system